MLSFLMEVYQAALVSLQELHSNNFNWLLLEM